MTDNSLPGGMGWLPDPPDMRDLSIDFDAESAGQTLCTASGAAAKLTNLTGFMESLRKSGLQFRVSPPPEHHLNVKWCPPVKNQGALSTGTTHAGVALLEYSERRAFGKQVDASRLFLYKVTRNLMGVTGDTGTDCRSTMAGLALFGVPPEKYWPYVIPDFDKEPSSFVYSLAQNYQGLVYLRLDLPGTTIPTLLLRIKISIANGWPVMFGFTLYHSYTQATATGEIPYPVAGEQTAGGKAVVAIGYDDKKKIRNSLPGGLQTEGAFLFQNSWGTNWGCQPPGGSERGYGWLPYEYVLRAQARDCWTLTKAEWVDTGNFGI